MEFEIKVTPYALEQIKETIHYISHTLLSANAAKHWADVLENEIKSLSFMPLRYPLVQEEPWQSKGIRKMCIKNFIIYYIVDKNQNQVFVTAVVYGRRDQIGALLDMGEKINE